MSTRTAAFERDVRDAISLVMVIKAVFDANDEVSRTSRPRDEYFPVFYFEPPGGVPLGYDPGASTNHRRVLPHAADGATPTADRLDDSTLPGVRRQAEPGAQHPGEPARPWHDGHDVLPAREGVSGRTVSGYPPQ